MSSQPKTEEQETLPASPVRGVTVVIPALHRPDLTRRCIDSLQNQTIPAEDVEVVVVENEARPGTILPDPLPRHVRRIELRENYGTTGSINRGVAAAQSEYVLLLNNDVELTPHFLASLISALESGQKYGFATGKLLSASDRQRLDGAGDALLVGGGAFRLGHGDRDRGKFNTSSDVLVGCGAATLFRRSVFAEVGGLDEDFFAYVDDIDLGLRAQLLGYRGVYVPGAVAYHIGSATLGDSLHPKVVEWITRNQILLIAKDYPRKILIRLLPRIALFQALWFGLALRQRRFRAYIKGILGALRLLPRMIHKRSQLMRQRRVRDGEFLTLLRNSEKQIYCWHSSMEPRDRSRLLSTYFWFFRPR